MYLFINIFIKINKDLTIQQFAIILAKIFVNLENYEFAFTITNFIVF